MANPLGNEIREKIIKHSENDAKDEEITKMANRLLAKPKLAEFLTST